MPRETLQPINVDNIILKLLKGFLENERKLENLTDFVYKKVDNVKLTEKEMSALCYKAREVFLGQPVLLELEAPLKIVGDIHGQYYDLLQVLKRGGFPPESNYLFLGDYVDRGRQSLETISLLLAYKIKYPENFFILRGNHECASITRIYGFFEECKKRYRSIKLWKTFMDVFNCLPIAAIIDDKIFCCHGGISPELISMDQIRRIRRPSDIPDSGLLCDLLWSDPEEGLRGWGINDRGVSYTFGADMIAKFLHKHNFDLICRAHQVVQDGYEFFAKRQLVTVFSAPNYCDEFDNAAAIMIVDDDLMCRFEIFCPKKLFLENVKKLTPIKETKENTEENNEQQQTIKIKEVTIASEESTTNENVEESEETASTKQSNHDNIVLKKEKEVKNIVEEDKTRIKKYFEKIKNFTSSSSSLPSTSDEKQKKKNDKVEVNSIVEETEAEDKFEIEE